METYRIQWCDHRMNFILQIAILCNVLKTAKTISKTIWIHAKKKEENRQSYLRWQHSVIQQHFFICHDWNLLSCPLVVGCKWLEGALQLTAHNLSKKKKWNEIGSIELKAFMYELNVHHMCAIIYLMIWPISHLQRCPQHEPSQHIYESINWCYKFATMF